MFYRSVCIIQQFDHFSFLIYLVLFFTFTLFSDPTGFCLVLYFVMPAVLVVILDPNAEVSIAYFVKTLIKAKRSPSDLIT